MGVKIQLFEVGAYRSDFCLWGWMKREVYKEKVNTRDELVASIMNSIHIYIQGVSGGIVNILGGGSTDYSE